jgi:amino acid transporter
MVRVVAASTFSALLAYVVVSLAVTNQTELSALRLGGAIVMFAGVFSLAYLGLAKALRISEVTAVLALVRRK